MGKAEIPQELARKAVELCRYIADDSECPGDGIYLSAEYREHYRNIMAKLDALEQPEDPAEVAGEKARLHILEWWQVGPPCPSNAGIIIARDIRHAYAKREEVVEALSCSVLRWGERGILSDEGRISYDLNARVRREFGWDK